MAEAWYLDSGEVERRMVLRNEVKARRSGDRQGFQAPGSPEAQPYAEAA
jgi:hypothetical protein